MQYISGIHALNLTCKLDTCGDWHQSSIQWQNPCFLESEESFFGEYGIEDNKYIPMHSEQFHCANHIRAILDLLLMKKFDLAQGMYNELICNENYTEEIFNKVLLMQELPYWHDIDRFMEKEYLLKWVHFKKDVKNKPLRIEISFRKKRIDEEESTEINGINVYKIENILGMKLNAFQNRDKIRDLYDIVFILKKYSNEIPNNLINQVKDAFSWKGLDYFDYLIETQADDLIDKDKLAQDYLDMFEKLDLLNDRKVPTTSVNMISHISPDEDDDMEL
ncbi:MAG: nucleotidyl transferase AbiEii/AbiGii toxin family protein [Clostridiales bacterium]